MRGGQQPKPVAVQIAEGDPSKHGVNKLRERLEREPQARRGLPDCPEHLTGRAREAWDAWKEDIEAMDIDRRPDAAMLEQACMNYAINVDAYIAITRDGAVIEEPILDKTGELIGSKTKKNPMVEIFNSTSTQTRLFLSEFGFSPASRTRVATDKKPDAASDLAAILDSPRVEREKHPVQ